MKLGGESKSMVRYHAIQCVGMEFFGLFFSFHHRCFNSTVYFESEPFNPRIYTGRMNKFNLKMLFSFIIIFFYEILYNKVVKFQLVIRFELETDLYPESPLLIIILFEFSILFDGNCYNIKKVPSIVNRTQFTFVSASNIQQKAISTHSTAKRTNNFIPKAEQRFIFDLGNEMVALHAALSWLANVKGMLEQ